MEHIIQLEIDRGFNENVARWIAEKDAVTKEASETNCDWVGRGYDILSVEEEKQKAMATYSRTYCTLVLQNLSCQFVRNTVQPRFFEMIFIQIWLLISEFLFACKNSIYSRKITSNFLGNLKFHAKKCQCRK